MWKCSVRDILAKVQRYIRSQKKNHQNSASLEIVRKKNLERLKKEVKETLDLNLKAAFHVSPKSTISFVCYVDPIRKEIAFSFVLSCNEKWMGSFLLQLKLCLKEAYKAFQSRKCTKGTV